MPISINFMGRLLQLKAWADSDTLAERMFGIEPPINLWERMAVWYFKQHFGERIREVLTANPIYALKRHIREFNEENGTKFTHLHDVEIKDLRLKKFKKQEKEAKPVVQRGMYSVDYDYIERIPPEHIKRLIPKDNPNEAVTFYMPLETVSQLIASFKGTITLLSPLFGDKEREYNIRIDVVQYQNTRVHNPEKVEPGDVKIQVYIHGKNTIPCTAYEYGVDLTRHTWDLARKLGFLNQPQDDIADIIMQVPHHLRKRNVCLNFIYQEMWRLRETVKKYVEGFLENNIISPTSVLTFFDHAKVNMKFAETPGDLRPEIIRQFHEGEVDGRYFYNKQGAEAYETACRSEQYVYNESEKQLLAQHAGEAVEAVSPETVVSLGCGSGEKEHDLFKDKTESKIPHFIGIDASPAMLAFFIDRMKRLNPDVETIFDDLRKIKLPDTLNQRVLYTFLGNTLGNFSLQEQIIILSKIAHKMKPGEKLLLGLNKFNPKTDNQSFEYDESATEFVSGAITNINIKDLVSKLKQFDIEQRIHYILVTIQADCEIEINGEKHRFKKGEQAKLIQSKRYSNEEVEELMHVSGFEDFEIFENEHTLFVVVSK